jgi:hypothetical protein
MSELFKSGCVVRNATVLYFIAIIALLITKPKFIHQCNDNNDDCKYTFIFPLAIVILAIAAYYSSIIVTRLIK